MSYILDALKKIEQKRAQEEAVKPLSFYEAAGEKSPKRALWPILLIGALVLNAGLLFWWLGFKGGDKKETQVRSAPAPAAVPAPSVALRTPGDQLKAIKKELPALRPASAPASEQTEKKKEKAPVQKPEEKAAAAKPVKPETAPPKPKEETPTEKGPARKSNRLVNLEELPEGVRKTLPTFKVSAHVYTADPEGRLIRINDRTLLEGQEVSPGIKVEEIIPGGAVLSYQGYRFRLGLKE
jgi:general secretion pathway protein B